MTICRRPTGSASTPRSTTPTSWRRTHCSPVRQSKQLAAGSSREVLLPTLSRGKLERTVVIEFANVEAAHAAHESAAYKEALAALDGGVTREIRIVEGLG